MNELIAAFTSAKDPAAIFAAYGALTTVAMVFLFRWGNSHLAKREAAARDSAAHMVSCNNILEVHNEKITSLKNTVETLHANVGRLADENRMLTDELRAARSFYQGAGGNTFQQEHR